MLLPRLKFSIGLWLILPLLLSPLIALILMSLGGYTSSILGVDTAGLKIKSLVQMAQNSALLVLLTMLGSSVLGVSSAFLITLYDFPFRRTLSWMLALPLAMPSYVIAFVYTDLLEYAGPVQSGLREIMAWQDARAYWFPDIRSLGGAATVLSLTFYPYIYLSLRTALSEQSQSLFDAANTMGDSALRRFWRILVPMLRPAFIAGLALVAMETLADFGTVNFFELNVLTKGLYDLANNRGNLVSAAQLAVGTIALIFLFLWIEQYFRRHSYSLRHSEYKRKRRPLMLFKGLGALIICLVPFLFALFLPMLRLLFLALSAEHMGISIAFFDALKNAFMIASIVCIIVFFTSFYVTLCQRFSINNKRLAFLGTVITLGYAVPGLMLGLAVLIFQRVLDPILVDIAHFAFGYQEKRLLTGSIAAVLLAITLRFFAYGYNNLNAGFLRISPSIDAASKSLGDSNWQSIIKIFLPLLKNSFAVALLLVFIEAMKELPATLLLRPAGMQSLATYVYDTASAGFLEEIAFGALILLILGIFPTIFLIKTGEKRGLS